MAISDWIGSRKISEIKIKPYQREIERYGAIRIDAVEDYFFYNSGFVLDLLQETDDSFELYAVSMLFIECTLAYAGYDIEQQLFFAKAMAHMFAEEHGIDKGGFKLINSDYNKNFRAKKEHVDIWESVSGVHPSILKAGALIRECEDLKRDGLAADLFHMHVNRLFHNEGRMHELVIYQFLAIKLKRMLKSRINK